MAIAKRKDLELRLKKYHIFQHSKNWTTKAYKYLQIHLNCVGDLAQSAATIRLPTSSLGQTKYNLLSLSSVLSSLHLLAPVSPRYPYFNRTIELLYIYC